MYTIATFDLALHFRITYVNLCKGNVSWLPESCETVSLRERPEGAGGTHSHANGGSGAATITLINISTSLCNMYTMNKLTYSYSLKGTQD
jgi:hypothetical protein